MNKVTELTLKKVKKYFKTGWVFMLVSVITALLLFAAPVQVFAIISGSILYQGELGSPVSFSLTTNVQDADMVWLQFIDVRIYNEAYPDYAVYINNLPYNTTTVSYTSDDTAGGPVDVSANVTEVEGSVNITYDFTWTSPLDWPEGSYKMTVYITGHTGTIEIPAEMSILLSAPIVSHPPVLECKWETPDDGDPVHNLSGTQALPSQTYEVDTQISLFAVVSDTDGISTITTVSAVICYPAGLPHNGTVKSQSALTVMEKQSGIMAIMAAYSEGLITFNAGGYDTILDQLNNDEAAVFTQSAALHYNDPAGDYTVTVSAVDSDGNSGNTLSNSLTYVPVASFQIDFTALNYGEVTDGNPGYITGDNDMSTPLYPTVRNVGNTNLILVIRQDDMGLGSTDGIPNVSYEAYLGPGGTPVSFLPEENAVLTDILPLSGTASINFSLYINQAESSQYDGKLNLSAEYAPFN